MDLSTATTVRNRWVHWWMKRIKSYRRLGTNVIQAEHDRLAQRLNRALMNAIEVSLPQEDYSI